jgi:hypothetical protein
MSRAAIALACLCLFSASRALAQCEHPIFDTPDIYVAGYGTPDVALGDVNNDSWVDMVVANAGLFGPPYDISVFFNYGDGTFHPPAHHWIDPAVWRPVLDDFNGDNWLDIACYDYNGFLVVLFNEGDGTFGSPVTYDVSYPSDVTSGDINGDEWPDIAVTAYTPESPDQVCIFFNNGDGTFSDPVPYPTGNPAAYIAAGDMNGDGWLDIAISSVRDDKINVLLNDGGGTFGSPVSYETGENTEELRLGDVDGDECLDIAVVNSLGAGLVSIFLNNGDGTFGDAVSYPAGVSPRSLALGDLNGDNWLDVAVANCGYYSIFATVLLNNADGTFGEGYQYDTGNEPHSVDIADLDKDGWMDMTVARYHDEDETNTVPVFLNLCPNSCPADFDGDGDVDTQDLLYLLATWGTPDGDVDGDGDTDTADLLALLGTWGDCPE